MHTPTGATKKSGPINLSETPVLQASQIAGRNNILSKRSGCGAAVAAPAPVWNGNRQRSGASRSIGGGRFIQNDGNLFSVRDHIGRPVERGERRFSGGYDEDDKRDLRHQGVEIR